MSLALRPPKLHLTESDPSRAVAGGSGVFPGTESEYVSTARFQRQVVRRERNIRTQAQLRPQASSNLHVESATTSPCSGGKVATPLQYASDPRTARRFYQMLFSSKTWLHSHNNRRKLTLLLLSRCYRRLSVV
ncbi:hypothetical protein PLICRDRAFT_548955 [Plicaturopsis crispa FD-325 SS-3]|nr:hypothetical protein PLICRDRAFT_548955 [Plicaturopsis crispa FD-325 SS-3]